MQKEDMATGEVREGGVFICRKYERERIYSVSNDINQIFGGN